MATPAGMPALNEINALRCQPGESAPLETKWLFRRVSNHPSRCPSAAGSLLFDQVLRGTLLYSRPPEHRRHFGLCLGIAREHPDQLRTQPLEIGRQQNGGNAGTRMHKLPGELRDEREVFVQAPRKRRGGFVVASIDGGEE